MSMRMLLLAGAVAAAVLAGVVVVGLRLVGEDDQHVLIVAVGDGQGEETNVKRAIVRCNLATAACERGLEESRGAVAASRSVGSVEERALQLFTAATEIESTVLAELQVLPRPAADDLAIGRALEIIANAHDEDLLLIDRLRQKFDEKLFERRVNAALPVSDDLRRRFESLGAEGCVRYYDPVSYSAG